METWRGSPANTTHSEHTNVVKGLGAILERPPGVLRYHPVKVVQANSERSAGACPGMRGPKGPFVSAFDSCRQNALTQGTPSAATVLKAIFRGVPINALETVSKQNALKTHQQWGLRVGPMGPFGADLSDEILSSRGTPKRQGLHSEHKLVMILTKTYCYRKPETFVC